MWNIVRRRSMLYTAAAVKSWINWHMGHASLSCEGTINVIVIVYDNRRCSGGIVGEMRSIMINTQNEYSFIPFCAIIVLCQCDNACIQQYIRPNATQCCWHCWLHQQYPQQINQLCKMLLHPDIKWLQTQPARARTRSASSYVSYDSLSRPPLLSPSPPEVEILNTTTLHRDWFQCWGTSERQKQTWSESCLSGDIVIVATKPHLYLVGVSWMEESGGDV